MDFESMMKILIEWAAILATPLVVFAAVAGIRILWKRGSQVGTSGKELVEQLDALRDRLDALEQRGLTSGEVASQYARLAELEERIDFAERLLAQRSLPALPMPGEAP
jgi:hypothetical protein